MADKAQVELIQQGSSSWKSWKRQHPKVKIDLSDANLSNLNLQGINLGKANLSAANLSSAKLQGAKLTGANLRSANLTGTLLSRADLNGADLSGANLSTARLNSATLGGTNFSGADLSGVDFRIARMFATNFRGANLSGCKIYGVSVWDVALDETTIQSNLVITNDDQPTITVDNLEVAQFIYLLINNQKLRSVIDTISSKVVLILGRFTPERKVILEAIRDGLRKFNYIPVLFDFEKPTHRDFVETVSTIAHLSKFVVADFTDAKIVLEEVPHIVRNIAVPVKPLLLESSGREPVTLINLRRNQRSLLDTYFYKDLADLIASLEEVVIKPSEALAKHLITDHTWTADGATSFNTANNDAGSGSV